MDNKRYSPACERNQLPILNVLNQHFPSQCRVLEVASGTGQHAEFFTSQMPEWIWQASDTDPDAISSTQVYREEANRKNFKEPLILSTQDETWDLGQFDAALCCNMIHISPWESCLGLFRHLAMHLKTGAKLALYGPFFQDGVETAQSNLDFDRSLRDRDPSWGIRGLADVQKVAQDHKFKLVKAHKMPANNLTVVFLKDA